MTNLDNDFVTATFTKTENKSIPDVRAFPGHIACDSRSLSEIVVPLRDPSGTIVAVLDVDSDKLGQFDEADAAGLQAIIELLNK